MECEEADRFHPIGVSGIQERETQPGSRASRSRGEASNPRCRAVLKAGRAATDLAFVKPIFKLRRVSSRSKYLKESAPSRLVLVARRWGRRERPGAQVYSRHTGRLR